MTAPLQPGYAGLGVIGRGMVGNLLNHWPNLPVWNRTASRCEPFAERGAVPVATPAELARRCNVIAVCVSDTPDVEAVVFGKGGLLEGAQPGTIIVDFSTISPERTIDFARRAAERGVRWVDAPVSGGDVGARNGTLTIMAGGEREDFDRVLPMLERVGRKIVHMGPVGSGQKTKLVNQVAVMGTIVSMAESMNFAREMGMDVAAVIDVVGSGAAGSWSLNNYGPRVLKGDFAPGFSIQLMAKDLRLVRENLAGLKADYETVLKLSAICDRLVSEGKGHEGLHAVVKELGWKG